jgi:hypothetical protein
VAYSHVWTVVPSGDETDEITVQLTGMRRVDL